MSGARAEDEEGTADLEKQVRAYPCSLFCPAGPDITYTFNSAQQPVSAADSHGNQYATGATYAPAGALSSLVNGKPSGNFQGITASYAYNNRLEPTTLTATSYNGTALNLTYSFVDGNGSNNGNVESVANNKDATHGRDQSFSYDYLNRILTAHTGATWGPNCWGFTYGADPLGNLFSKTPWAGTRRAGEATATA